MILDSHAHAFPDRIAAGALQTLTKEALWMPVRAHTDGTIAGLLASMDAAGIDRTVMCSVATRSSQVPRITEWSAQIASERIIPFASIHPDFDQPEAEIERIAVLGIRGLKFHPYYMNCPVDDPRVLRIARAAARYNLAMATHAGYDLAFPRSDVASPLRIRRLHEAVPDLRLQACHLGGWQCWDQSLEHLAGLPVWMETSFTLGQCPPDMLERLLDAHPREYLLFGTDSPWAEQTGDLAKFRALPVDDDVKTASLWDNALRWIGIQR